MSIEIILTSNVKDLGSEGDQIKVAGGFARNYLLPQNLAVVADEASKKRIESLRLKKTERERAELAAAQENVKKLEKLTLALQAPLGEQKKLFGSITARDIAKSLSEKGFEVDRKQIEIESPIRKAGQYEVTVKLHADVSARVKIKVEGGEEVAAGDTRGTTANTRGTTANTRGTTANTRGTTANTLQTTASTP